MKNFLNEAFAWFIAILVIAFVLFTAGATVYSLFHPTPSSPAEYEYPADCTGVGGYYGGPC